MFIYAIHGNTLKFFGIIGVAVVALVLIIALVPGSNTIVEAGTSVTDNVASAEVSAVSFDKVKTNEERIALLKSFGWEVESDPMEEADVTIPAEFDRVMENYNAIQRSQGFDLSKYRNRDVKRYTYRVTNYPNYEGTVYANLLIYKNRVVGGDICSSDVNGFILSLNGK